MLPATVRALSPLRPIDYATSQCWVTTLKLGSAQGTAPSDRVAVPFMSQL
jgi:hypothetical protein